VIIESARAIMTAEEIMVIVVIMVIIVIMVINKILVTMKGSTGIKIIERDVGMKITIKIIEGHIINVTRIESNSINSRTD
jgi:hypothetical protein